MLNTSEIYKCFRYLICAGSFCILIKMAIDNNYEPSLTYKDCSVSFKKMN